MLSKLSALLTTTKAISAYKNKRVHLSYLPTFLWIEPTNKCNLECIICPNRMIPKEDMGFMKWDLFKKIVNEVKDFVSIIALYMRGESLLHKDIFNMIRYIKQYNLKCILHTNVTLLNKENSKKLLNSGIDYVSLSFNGYDKETYERIRKNAKFEVVLNNIINLLKEKKGRGKKAPYIALQTLITGIENYGYEKLMADEFYNKIKKEEINEINIKRAQSWGNHLSKTDKFKIPKLGEYYSPCPYLWAFVGVSWNGDVVPCCVDFLPDHTLGNVYEKSLKQIWNDSPYKILRSKMIDQTYWEIKRNCLNCHMLWSNKKKFGYPTSLLRLISIPFLNIFGLGFEKYMKLFGQLLTKSLTYKIRKR